MSLGLNRCLFKGIVQVFEVELCEVFIRSHSVAISKRQLSCVHFEEADWRTETRQCAAVNFAVRRPFPTETESFCAL